MYLFFAQDLERGSASAEDDELLELVRWRVEEIAAQLGELEDAKTLVGLLLFLRDEHPGTSPTQKGGG